MQATEYVIVPEGCKPGVRIYIYSPLFEARLATQSILCFGFKWHFPPFACTHAPSSLGWGEFHHNKMQKSICRRTLSSFHFCRFPVFGGAPHDFFEAEICTRVFLFTSRLLLATKFVEKYSPRQVWRQFLFRSNRTLEEP
jgi:hypothetical protein